MACHVTWKGNRWILFPPHKFTKTESSYNFLFTYVCTFSMNDAKLKIIEVVKMMTPLIPNNKSPSGSNKTSKPELVLVWDIEKRTKIRLVAIWWVTSKLTSIFTAIMLIHVFMKQLQPSKYRSDLLILFIKGLFFMASHLTYADSAHFWILLS